MTRYCQKCGKELIKDGIVGFDKNSGDPIAEYSCPVYLKEMKTLKKRRSENKKKVEDLYHSKENKTPFFTKLFTGRTIKKTMTQIFLEEDSKAFEGLHFNRGLFGLSMTHTHDNGVMVNEKTNEIHKEEDVV